MKTITSVLPLQFYRKETDTDTFKIASLGNEYISISKQNGKTPCPLNLFRVLRCEGYNTLTVCLHN